MSAPGGSEAAANAGRAGLYFSVIPAALAGAALMWLAFYTGAIDWQKTRRIEGRMAERVGVRGEPTAPVDLVIRKTGCFGVSRAFLDEGSLTAYVTNGCDQSSGYYEWHWNQVAPDGTIIEKGYHNAGDSQGLQHGETIEVTDHLSSDARTVKVVVWANRGLWGRP